MCSFRSLAAKIPKQNEGVEGRVSRGKSLFLDTHHSTLASLGPDNQNRIARVTHDLFGYASQRPTLYPGAPVSAHGDQIVRCCARQVDDLVGSGAYQQNEGDLLDTVSSNLIDLRLQVSAGFPSDRGQERVLVRDVGSVCSRVGRQRKLIRARENDFET